MTTTVMLNDDQKEIQRVARDFLKARFPSDRIRELIATEDGFEIADWSEIADLGWVGIALPEESGGAGYSFVERCLLLEEMGRVLLPGPFLSSGVLAADLVSGAAGPGAADLLNRIAAGSTRAAAVAAGDLMSGQEPSGALTAAEQDGVWRLSGDGGLVFDGASAEVFIAVASLPDGGVGLFEVDASGPAVERSAAQTVDETRRTATVRFGGTEARRLDDGEATAEGVAQALDRGAISLAAEMVGGAQRAIEMTVEYLNEREQFGRPIGQFQALKHRVADLFVTTDAAREAVYSAADVVLAGQLDNLPAAAAVAKQAASDGYVRTAAEAIQLHGGIGFTEEHDIGLYYKRAVVSAAALGTSLAHTERIAEALDV